MFDFKNEIPEYFQDIETKFKGKKLILKNIFLYDGPITMQYLPNGGIQSLFHNNLIIKTESGFIATKEVEYDGINYTIGEFSIMYDDLVNTVLPN